jgi:hypothetical protein
MGAKTHLAPMSGTTPRLVIKRLGDALRREPDARGYDPDWSEVLALVLPDPRIESHSKVLRHARDFLNFVHGEDDRLDRINDEEDETAMARVDAFLASKGAIVKPPAKKGRRREERDVSVRKGRSTGTIEFIITVVRRIYRELMSLGLRSKGNPCDVLGWHLMREGEQYAIWRRRHPKAVHGFDDAGLRFRIAARTVYPPLLHDPTNVGWRMTDALVQSGRPETVIDIGGVQEDNGCRWREAAHPNALGWAMEGFGPNTRTSNKHDKNRYGKTISIPPDPFANLMRRMTTAPHPDDPSRTRLDWLRERHAAGDRATLAKEPLFPSGPGRFWSSSGFNHHFRKAMREYDNGDGTIGLMIHSDIGSRRPTPHWYRHAVISIEVERIYETYEKPADVRAAVDAMCERLGLKSDQSSRYAARIIKRRSEAMRNNDVERRRVEALAARQGVKLNPGTLRVAAGASAAARQIAAFPARAVPA